VRPAPWRVPLRAFRLEHARSSGDLGQFGAWMETGYPDYRMRQRSSQLKRTVGRLRDLERDRAERIAGVLRLRALDAIAPAAREGDPLPLLRVPLLIEDRDAVTLELRRRGIEVFSCTRRRWTTTPGRSSASPLRCRRQRDGGQPTSSR
jgi:hypothetical protein